MSKFIPNERSLVYFAPSGTVTRTAGVISLAVADFATMVNLTPQVISLNASSQGNTVPTPSLDTLFETSIPGTVQASFSGDFYRDDEPADDLAWTTLPRGTQGDFVISRTGIAGASPAAADIFEVWPAWIVSRTMSNMSSNTAATFTVQAAVFEEPDESVTVVA